MLHKFLKRQLFRDFLTSGDGSVVSSLAYLVDFSARQMTPMLSRPDACI